MSFAKKLLDNVERGIIVLGCGSPKSDTVDPWEDFDPLIAGMVTTESSGGFYWHITIDGLKFELQR